MPNHLNTIGFAQSALDQSEETGAELGRQLSHALKGQPAGAVLVFASSRYDYVELLKALTAVCPTPCLVGCSSAGEFVSCSSGEGGACAVALAGDGMRFSVGLGRDLSGDPRAAARSMVSGFQGLQDEGYNFRSALVFADALSGSAEDLVEQLTAATQGQYQLVGGGAGDDGNFRATEVFLGTESYGDAAVALEILSDKPLGIGVSHGWEPSSEGLRVTRAEGKKLISLNALPAREAFEEHAQTTGQSLDLKQPISFFLHNVLGIASPQGHKLRVPLSFEEDGSVLCASEIPEGAVVHFMQTSSKAGAEAAVEAARRALKELNEEEPLAGIFFDCVATRLRMGKEFGIELQELKDALGGAEFAGYNTYGQIARAEGQFCGFHNCTAVVCVIPR